MPGASYTEVSLPKNVQNAVRYHATTNNFTETQTEALRRVARLAFATGTNFNGDF